MTVAEPQVAPSPVSDGGRPPGRVRWLTRRRAAMVGGAAALLVVGGAVVAIAQPFGGPGKVGSGVTDNQYPISYQHVTRGTITSQTEVSGTLGYAGSTSIVVPSGTATSTLQQAEQQFASARQTLFADKASLANTVQGNGETLAQAQQNVTAARQTLALDEAGSGTAGKANNEAYAQAEQQVVAAEKTLRQDQAALTTAQQGNGQANSAAEAQVASAKTTLDQDEAALNTVEKSNLQAVAQAQGGVASARSTLAGDEAALQNVTEANNEALGQANQQVTSARATLAADEKALSTAGASNSEAVDQAESQLSTAKATLATDQSQLATDQASLSAEQAKESADCAGSGAATPHASSGSGGSSACATDESQVVTDQSAVTSDKTKVASDQAAVTSAEQSVASTKTNNDKSTQQAEAQVAQARAALVSAEQSVASTKTNNDKSTQQAEAQVAQARAALVSAEQSVASTKTNNDKSTQQAEAQVAQARAALVSAEQAVASAETNNEKGLQQAQAQYNAAKLAVSEDVNNLRSDQSDAAVTGLHSTYTALPGDGKVVRRGQQLFAISGTPSLLLYGDVTPSRAFLPGMTPGPDVGALNANLDALGYGKGLSGDRFTAGTEAAVKAMQRAHGMIPTGQLPIGTVLFEPGAVRVTSVTPKLGGTVAAGQPVLSVTLLTRQVEIALDTSQQSEVQLGDKVSIVLPDNSTTGGVVTSIGSSVTTNSSGSTIAVLVTPTDPAVTGALDAAPVNVWVTTATANNAYIVPVDALLALSSGGYALEVAGPRGVHQLEAVTLGLFDDADGLVQVSGPGVRTGQKIVVPQI